MNRQGRASIFGEDGLDVSGFQPKPDRAGERPEQVRAIAEHAAFRSREPEPGGELQHHAAQGRAPRRHRTGRNVQLNLKIRQEDADAFYAIADKHGWVLGEAFQHAVAALTDKLTG